jgi:integrase/recombinase XerC
MPTDLIPRYAAYLRSLSSSPRTIGDWTRTLTAMDRDLPYGLEQANADELIAWLWRDGLSMASRDAYYSAMAGFYRWAVKFEIFDFNPAADIARPKPPHRLPNPVTDAELIAVLERAADPYRTWVLLAAYGGLRCIEISRLRREHITEQTITLHGKGGKKRIVPTHPAVWAVVGGLPAGPITEHDERYISIRSALYFQRTLKMPDIHMHRFRHWFGTNVQRRNKDLRVTQQLMGHSNPSTTAGYALVFDEDATAAVNALPDLAASVAG